jgi:phenol hydroxylase P4 protein
MSVTALTPGYVGEIRDRVDNFHGKQLLYIGWVDHLIYCAPLCISVPPDLLFAALTNQIIPSLYPAHPDTAKICWDQVEWFRSQQRFTPDLTKTLVANGLGHKALLRFRTPGLTGINGSCS